MDSTTTKQTPTSIAIMEKVIDDLDGIRRQISKVCRMDNMRPDCGDTDDDGYFQDLSVEQSREISDARTMLDSMRLDLAFLMDGFVDLITEKMSVSEEEEYYAQRYNGEENRSCMVTSQGMGKERLFAYAVAKKQLENMKRGGE